MGRVGRARCSARHRPAVRVQAWRGNATGAGLEMHIGRLMKACSTQIVREKTGKSGNRVRAGAVAISQACASRQAPEAKLS